MEIPVLVQHFGIGMIKMNNNIKLPTGIWDTIIRKLSRTIKVDIQK